MRPLSLKSLEDIPEHHLSQKTIFVRLDLNLPRTPSGELTDLSRLHHALPTLKYLLSKTSKLILASHLGRPPQNPTETERKHYSLEVVGEKISELLGCDVVLFEDVDVRSAASLIPRLSRNQIILLENLRFFPGEKENSSDFSRLLAHNVDYYVNEAFGVCHRKHSSVVGIPELMGKERCFAGWGLKEEIEVLSSLLHAPKPPLMVVMGGSKVADKMGAILGLLPHAHTVMIGGAMAYPFLACRGVAVGKAAIKDDQREHAQMILEELEERHIKLVLPVDHVCAQEVSAKSTPIVTQGEEVPAELYPLDMGPESQKLFRKHLLKAATILWNGPMGVFEWESFAAGSHNVALAVADSKALSVVGGGDSLACLRSHNLSSHINHLSTGGGAMLAFLHRAENLAALTYLTHSL